MVPLSSIRLIPLLLRYLLPNAESEPFEVAEHIVAASSKLILLDKLLADILPKGEKVLVFSGFTRMLDILEDFANLRGFKCTLPLFYAKALD